MLTKRRTRPASSRRRRPSRGGAASRRSRSAARSAPSAMVTVMWRSPSHSVARAAGILTSTSMSVGLHGSDAEYVGQVGGHAVPLAVGVGGGPDVAASGAEVPGGVGGAVVAGGVAQD